jgi:hypothetical protein
MLVYPKVDWGKTTWCLVFTCLVCQMSPKQVWSRPLAAVPVHLFSQCNVVWRSFLRDRGSGSQSFDSPWCFISAKFGSSISARFLIHRASVPYSPSWILWTWSSYYFPLLLLWMSYRHIFCSFFYGILHPFLIILYSLYIIDMNSNCIVHITKFSYFCLIVSPL